MWEDAWAEFVPFLQFDAEIRRIVRTTDVLAVRGAARPVGPVGVRGGRAIWKMRKGARWGRVVAAGPGVRTVLQHG
nr:hypothetical protein [Streptomyces sp. MJM1172]